MIKTRHFFLSIFLFMVVCAPAQAATFEVGGWIPYWEAEAGTKDVLLHLEQVKTVHPFVFTVTNEGQIVDNGFLNQEPWTSFVAKAKAQKVRVIPTILWMDKEAMHKILSATTSRIALENRITALVMKNGFDGIDIDFEGKALATKKYFSIFLEGLYIRMGPKWVYCTIEANSSSNDLSVIRKYCDRVQIMAYDQGQGDALLSTVRAKPYAPIADPAWVERVVEVIAQTIPKKKIILGIPTYGYEYEITPAVNQGYRYEYFSAFNRPYALKIAQEANATPERNSSGELSFIYTPSSAIHTEIAPGPIISNNPPPVLGTTYSLAATAGDLLVKKHLMWWSDTVAIDTKVSLAHRLGLRGIVVFKLDGSTEEGMWSILK
jgi:spore germination protein YaaH